MECLCPLGEVCQVTVLQCFGEGVEERPDVTRFKRFMPGFAPLLQHHGHQSIGTGTDIGGPNDEIVRILVLQLVGAVCVDAGVLVMPFLHELADGSLHDEGEVPADEPRMLSDEFHLTGEAEVVADEDTGPGSNATRERLIVRISQPQYPAVVRIGSAAHDFHQAEIAHTLVREAVRLGANAEIVGFQGAFDLGDQVHVRDGCPRLGRTGSPNADDVLTIHGFCSAVQDQVGVSPLRLHPFK